MFQGSFECFKEVSGKCQGCFKKLSRVFQVRLKCISSGFKGVSRFLKEVQRESLEKFQRCVKKVSRVFKESF